MLSVTQTDDMINDLAEWLGGQTWSDFAQSLAAYHATKGYLTEKQIISAMKMRAKVEGKGKAAAKVTGAPVTEHGMYKDGDRIFKVQKAVQGSGNLYAKELIVDGHGEAHFDYAPGAIKKLTAEMKMTLDEAKAFGALYGTCCVCGRTLTDENSIAAGIGPVCAAKGFWG